MNDYKEKCDIVFKCIRCIESGKAIPFALRNLANFHKIDVKYLEETLNDVKEQASKTEQESSTDWSRRYDEWTEEDQWDSSDNP